MTGMKPDDSSRLIESEKQRLELERNERIKENQWCGYITKRGELSLAEFIDGMTKSSSFINFEKYIDKHAKSKEKLTGVYSTLKHSERARRDFNEVRKLLGLSTISLTESELLESARATGDSKPPDVGEKK
jgi:hypothetical protein